MTRLSVEFIVEAMHIADILRQNSVSSVLDVGCGTGLLGVLLSLEYGIHVTGTDIDCSVSAIECIEGRIPDTLSNIRDRSYDAVVVQHMIEHIPKTEQYRLLLEASRIARSLLVVVTPNRKYRWKHPDGIYDPSHKHLLSPRELGEMMYVLMNNNHIRRYSVYTINNFMYVSRKYHPLMCIVKRVLDMLREKPTIICVAWV